MIRKDIGRESDFYSVIASFLTGPTPSQDHLPLSCNLDIVAISEMVTRGDMLLGSFRNRSTRTVKGND